MRLAIVNASKWFFGLLVLTSVFMFLMGPDGSVNDRVRKYFGPELPTVYFAIGIIVLIAVYVFFYTWQAEIIRSHTTRDRPNGDEEADEYDAMEGTGNDDSNGNRGNSPR